ncbi:hypothetical protein O181_054777 [Austropuccinia psidii MF-1]|uniref:Integrase catalytic domain-containing protein n=1 Tax=Austropuccinia psidii MF-1 TaxID=1389203 RepID=A0A9Q3E7J8_9BASI|nr:hypothetical protein [Austropuccinia psidii MF-1]
MIIQLQEPKSLWEIVHMDWVTALPPGGDRSYNSFLVLVDRYSKTPMFLPFHKDETAMDTSTMIFIILHSLHSKTDGLEERTTQNLEDIIRRFCAYVLEFKDYDGFTHDWCTLIQALEMAYRTSIHSSTGKTLEMLEKGWNPRLTYDTLKKDLLDIHPTASNFKMMLDKARHHANK